VAACYFQTRRGLLAAADAGDFRRVTYLVNGGYNGWNDRLRYWRRLGTLGVVPGSPDLKRGSREHDVEVLIRRLSFVTSTRTGKPYLDGVRSRLGMRTKRVLRAFQREHDIDLICPRRARLFAACRARVIDVRAGGWWGNNPTGNVALGDGIIPLEALESIGPLTKGMHIGYGHAVHATVRKGDVVKAGEVIGRAGFANAWHIHFMINGGQTTRGIGDRDPRPCLDLFTGRSRPPRT
jgi:hypothetical protein